MIQDIKLGAAPNDKTGDPARLAGQKINENFHYLEDLIKNQDQIIEKTTISLSGQNLTMGANWRWVISGVEYTNPVDVVINIPYAASGKQRFDVVVCTTSNTFQRIAGVESTSFPVVPPVPSGKIQATIILVSDAEVGPPSEPVVGNTYQEKAEFAPTDIYYDGIYQSFPVMGKSTRIVFHSVLTRLDGLQYIYASWTNGQILYVKNAQLTEVQLTHNATLTSTEMAWFFYNGQNLILKPGEIAQFQIDLINKKFQYVGIIASKDSIGLSNVDNTSDINKPVSTAQAAADSATLSAANSYTDGKLSSVYRVKGSVANYASLPSSGQIVGDVWNLTDTGMNYVWTGSVWDALGVTVDISGKEDSSNKTSVVSGNESSSTLFATLSGITGWIKNNMPSWLSVKTTLVDADGLLMSDSAASGQTKTISWVNFKAAILALYVDLTSPQTITGVKTIQSRWKFKEPDAIAINRGFQAVTRNVALTFPAVVIQPTDNTNTNIGFDVMPKGTPSDYGVYGAAWVHVCNKDCLDTNPDFNALRLGAGSSKVTISSDKFGAAANLPIEIQMSGTPVATFGIDGQTNFDAPQNASSSLKFRNTATGSASSSNITAETDSSATTSLISFNSGYTGITGASSTGWLYANAGMNELILNAAKSTGKIRFMTNGSVLATSSAGLITENKRWKIGDGSTPTATLHLTAGTASASTAPIKLTSGTNLTTPETGAIEYNGTNLFFTRSGTTRENVITTSAVNSVSPTSPNRTITVVIDGVTYYIAAKTTND